MQPNGLENYVVLDLVGEGSFGKVGSFPSTSVARVPARTCLHCLLFSKDTPRLLTACWQEAR